MHIEAVSAFDDNYIWVIRNDTACIVVDPGDAAPVLSYLEQHQLTLSAILITHHHHDHTGGIQELYATFKCPVYGPDNPSIQGITQTVCAEEQVHIHELNLNFQVIACPGHTLDHIAFYAKPWLFCGDTLFSAGCGRMFEGQPAQFWESLQRLSALPADTEIYCAHEYTAANLKFASLVEPDNKMIDEHSDWVKKKRQRGEKTLPTTIALEAQINPFLRCHLQTIKEAAEHRAQTSLSGPIEVFACLRHWKNMA